MSGLLITKWPRLILGIGSISSFMTGAVAVFISDNQAGSVALVVTGGVAGVVAALGMFPSKFSMGENSMEFGHVINQLANSDSPEVRKETQEAIDKVANRYQNPGFIESILGVSGPRTLRRGGLREIDAIKYLANLLDEAASDYDCTVEQEARVFDSKNKKMLRPDFLIRLSIKETPAVPLEVKMRFTQDRLDSALSQVRTYMAAVGSEKGVLIHDADPGSIVADEANDVCIISMREPGEVLIEQIFSFAMS